jgi:hypothetical protein
MLRMSGWLVSKKRIERTWRRERLKVPVKQPKRGCLWLNDDSCIRLRPEHPNYAWSYDFATDRTHDGNSGSSVTARSTSSRPIVFSRFRGIDAQDILLANEKVGLAKGVVRLGLRRHAKDHRCLAQPREYPAQEAPFSGVFVEPKDLFSRADGQPRKIFRSGRSR